MRGLNHTVPLCSLNGIEHAVLQKNFFKAGEVMVRKGEPCEEFIIIQEGTVRGSDIRVGESRFEDLTMYPGDSFGQL